MDLIKLMALMTAIDTLEQSLECSPGKCGQGHMLDSFGNCIPCPIGFYMDFENHACMSCYKCTQPGKNEVVIENCTTTSDTTRICRPGYYNYVHGPDISETRVCLQCSSCPPNVVIIKPCTERTNTVCGTVLVTTDVTHLKSSTPLVTTSDTILESNTPPALTQKMNKYKTIEGTTYISSTINPFVVPTANISLMEAIPIVITLTMLCLILPWRYRAKICALRAKILRSVLYRSEKNLHEIEMNQLNEPK